jgi:hypothetical protein
MDTLTKTEKKYIRDSLHELPVFPRTYKVKKGKYSAPLRWWESEDKVLTMKDFVYWSNRVLIVLKHKVKIVTYGPADNIYRVNVFFQE